ncbi:hypothetical protein C5S53_16120 [Methanophagales archaeon]|nr:hypothetical protein C5S53_16120 [Methanophagales archaeon]
MRNSAGAETDNVTYLASWGADGNGKTLERKATGEWAESLDDDGTPCRPNSVTPCFIATAAYGTPLHDDIAVLRDFRDEYLMPSPVGRTFVKIYYSFSPPIADLIGGNEGLMAVTREGLVKPLVYSCSRKLSFGRSGTNLIGNCLASSQPQDHVDFFFAMEYIGDTS